MELEQRLFEELDKQSWKELGDEFQQREKGTWNTESKETKVFLSVFGMKLKDARKIREEVEKMKENENLTSRKDFYTLGLPKVFCDKYDDWLGPSMHPEAGMKEKPFKISEDLPPVYLRDWEIPYAWAQKEKIIYSERGLGFHVGQLLSEAKHLVKKNSLYQKLDWFLPVWAEDNFLLEAPDSTPVGFVGIRVPTRRGIDSGRFFGQMYDNVRMHRDVFGVKDALGIMSTGKEWRICWIPPQGNDERILYASRIYQDTDLELPRVLATVILRASNSGISKPIFEKGCTRMKLSPSIISWDKLENDLTMDGFPSPTTEEFFVTRYFGRWGSGRIWEGCSSNGELCNIQIYFYEPKYASARDQLLESRDKELKVWHEVFDEPRVFATELIDAPALITPLLEQPTEWNDADQILVREAVAKYSQHHHSQSLDRKRVGFYLKDGQRIAVLFRSRPLAKVEGGLQGMLAQLKL